MTLFVSPPVWCGRATDLILSQRRWSNVLASRCWETVQNERAYLYAAVLNEARHHHRSTMRRRVGEVMASTSGEASVAPEVRPDVLQAVGRLSVCQRAVVFLTYSGGLDAS